MRRAGLTCALVCLVLLALGPVASAQQPDPLAFADSLCQAGDYFRAVGEYKRVLYLESADPALLSRARLHLGVCYGRAGGWQEAADLLREVSASESPEAELALFELGRVYYSAGMAQRAAETFQRFASRFPQSPRAGQALLSAGFSQLAAGDYPAAQATLAAVEGECAAALTRAALDPAPPQRSPVAAALLSAALPGAGQLYCGRPGQALASLLLTGATVFGAYAALSNGYEGAGTLAAIVAATAYAGSMRSAYACAQGRNRRSREAWLDGLAQGCDLSLTPGGLVLRY